MWIGWIEFDLLLGDVHCRRGDRQPRPASPRGVGVSVVAADSGHVIDVLDSVEKFVFSRPEINLLSTHRDLASSHDE